MEMEDEYKSIVDSLWQVNTEAIWLSGHCTFRTNRQTSTDSGIGGHVTCDYDTPPLFWLVKHMPIYAH